MDIRAVIFDRDNTLLHFDLARVAQLEACVQAIVPDYRPGAVASAWEAWPGPWPTTMAEEGEFWRAFWDAFARPFNLSAAQTLALHEISALYHTCFVAFPDAAPCIEALHAGGLRLAVLTNYELPSIHITLQGAGLDPHFFSALLSSSMIGVSKPDSRAYYTAADALGMAPRECIFVDDLVENVEAACAVGMHGVLLDRQCSSATGVFTSVRDLEELTALILEQVGVL